MYNQAGATNPFKTHKVLGGYTAGDFETHKILYAGIDPADPSRALVRKLVQINKTTYCYEEVRITPTEKSPVVHSQMYRIKGFDMKERLTPEEIQIRGAFRPIPNVMGFSLFYKPLSQSGNFHFSIVENTLFKKAGGTWLEWYQDQRDRRDIAAYLKCRWLSNHQ